MVIEGKVAHMRIRYFRHGLDKFAITDYNAFSFWRACFTLPPLARHRSMAVRLRNRLLAFAPASIRLGHATMPHSGRYIVYVTRSRRYLRFQ